MEESDDVDIEWRCRLLSAVALALIDQGKKPDGLKFLDKIADLVKKKANISMTSEEKIIRMRIFYNSDNAGSLGNIKKDCETGDTDEKAL